MKMLYCLMLCGLVALSGAVSAISFTPGHLYSTSDTDINEYDANGVLLSSLPVAEYTGLKGLSFNLDGYLYVVQDRSLDDLDSIVKVFDGSGNVIRSQTFDGNLGGHDGHIAFGRAGYSFFVGANQGLYKFSINGSTGSLFISVENGVNDIEVLPDNSLLVASEYAISHYSNTGVKLGEISTLEDPYDITPVDNPWLVAVRGVEYDPVNRDTFVTMLGYSGTVDMSWKILRLDGLTNTITGMATYTYGGDMFLTGDHRLLVGSRSLPPGIFSTDLDYLGQFTGIDARYVTALPVPEPSAYALMLAGFGLAYLFSCRVRSRSFESER